jgi:DNA-binding transcriptional MerR regulator
MKMRYGASMTDRMTVEELAAASGMTVRNVREHQTRGLLSPPHLEGRKGYYDQRHLQRLHLIRELQEEGLNLQAIGWLLARAPQEASDEVTRFKQALFAPWGSEPPTVRRTDELPGRGADPRSTARAVELGLIAPREDGRWDVPSPRLLEAGEELVRLGVPLSAALDTVEVLLPHLEAVADAFVRLFAEQVWQPFEAAQRPAAEWPRVREALERMRDVAADAVLAAFHGVMADAVDRQVDAGARSDRSVSR